MERLSIIIVNWNTGPLLARCLASINNAPDRNLVAKIVVVDNASHDDSISQAQAAVARDTFAVACDFLLLKENAGFAHANNLGLKNIPPGDHVLLLNPDTELLPHALQEMLAVLAENQNAGIVGPTLLNPDKTVQSSVRSFPTTPALLWLFLKLPRLLPRVPWWQRYMQTQFDYTRQQEVDQVMGAAFLIRREMLSSLGALDEDFWVWFEEVDYCRRAYDAGWNVLYTPRAQIIHHGAVSFNQLLGPARTVPLLNSALVYAHKHLATAAWLLLLSLYPLGVSLSLPAGIVHMVEKRAH